MILESERLIIRPFVLGDLIGIHRILEVTAPDVWTRSEPRTTLQERRSWLEWQIASYEWLSNLRQPPYGDRAVVLKETNTLIGSVGYVPLLMPFDQLPSMPTSKNRHNDYSTTEFGLFWTIDPGHQRRGYASEAARGMVEYAFKELRLKRIVAATEYSNLASQKVMQKIGMRLVSNPKTEPSWLQVVGYLENEE